MRLSFPRLASVPSVLLPAVVVLLVWLPLLSHYSVREPRITDLMVATAQQAPADAVLSEIRDYYLLPIDDRRPAMEVSVAEDVLRGWLILPDLPAARITLPFSPDDLEGLPPSLRLWFAGYVAPDFLLAAFAVTQREEFFSLAREMILAWNRYEARAWLPKGYLWNDHAIAARVRVLGEFWRLYRHRADYDPEVGRAVLQQAARYREFLANPGHFTFATNHGLMQNLGLLHLELAFPTLPEAARYERLALERLDEQLQFLISEDGVIRENSAGYQAFDLQILGMAFRCMTLLDAPVPPVWAQKYEQGIHILERLERPDGTLPATGDTDGAEREWLSRVTQVDRLGRAHALHARARTISDTELSVHPAAGYWIEWDGLRAWPETTALNQTVVTWTRPPAPSHKHADELAVIVWSNGTSWLTSVGYWPYGELGRAGAESWSAANAPHQASEPVGSERTARLLSYGRTSRLSALDAERRGPGAYVARRQVVHVKPDLWIIVDHVSADPVDANETVWTTEPEVSARRDRSEASYLLTTTSAAARLTFVGSDGTSVREGRGSLSPFAGWHVRRSVPEPAPAITVTQSAGDSWLVAVLSTASTDSPLYHAGGGPQVAAGSTADAWAIELPTTSGQLRITRAEGQIVVDQGTGTTVGSVELVPPPDPASELSTIRVAFDEAAAAYPVFLDRTARRAQVTGLLAALVLVQEGSLLLIRRGLPAYHVPLRVLSIFCWVGVGLWLHFVLLRSWETLVVS